MEGEDSVSSISGLPTTGLPTTTTENTFDSPFGFSDQIAPPTLSQNSDDCISSRSESHRLLIIFVSILRDLHQTVKKLLCNNTETVTEPGESHAVAAILEIEKKLSFLLNISAEYYPWIFQKPASQNHSELTEDLEIKYESDMSMPDGNILSTKEIDAENDLTQSTESMLDEQNKNSKGKMEDSLSDFLSCRNDNEASIRTSLIDLKERKTNVRKKKRGRKPKCKVQRLCSSTKENSLPLKSQRKRRSLLSGGFDTRLLDDPISDEVLLPKRRSQRQTKSVYSIKSKNIDETDIADDSVLNVCISGDEIDPHLLFKCNQPECDYTLPKNALEENASEENAYIIQTSPFPFFQMCAKHLYEQHDVLCPSVYRKCVAPGCDFVTVGSRRLKAHVSMKHNQRNARETCPECGKEVLARCMKQHFRNSHDEIKKLLCVQCGKEFSGQAGLRWHEMKIHGGEIGNRTKIFTCTFSSECKFWTNNKSEYGKHMYGKHKSIVDGVQVYQCSECEYKNVSRFIINKHKLTHTSVKGDITCSVCGAMLKCRASLLSHMKHMHADGPKATYPCKACGQEFLKKQSLKEHQQREHSLDGAKGKKMFRCAYCTHESFLSGNCLKHVRQVHPSFDPRYIDLRDGQVLLKQKGGHVVSTLPPLESSNVETPSKPEIPTDESQVDMKNPTMQAAPPVELSCIVAVPSDNQPRLIPLSVDDSAVTSQIITGLTMDCSQAEMDQKIIVDGHVHHIITQQPSYIVEATSLDGKTVFQSPHFTAMSLAPGDINVTSSPKSTLFQLQTVHPL